MGDVVETNGGQETSDVTTNPVAGLVLPWAMVMRSRSIKTKRIRARSNFPSLDGKIPALAQRKNSLISLIIIRIMIFKIIFRKIINTK